MKHLNSLYAIIVLSAVFPLTTFAQFGYQPNAMNINQFTGGFGSGLSGDRSWQTRAYTITNFTSLLNLAHTLLGYFQVIIFLLAILFALVGALLIIVHGNFEAGRAYLLWAFVGAVIALLSFAIIPIACFFTQASGPACTPGYIL